MRGKWVVVAALLFATTLAGSAAQAETPSPHRATTAAHQRAAAHRRAAKRKKIAHAAGWAGAGAAAGHLAGPAGSAAVGAAKYRRDLKKNWHTRRKAMVKIGAPIAVGAAAGPVGTAGYETFEHRKWIKRHLTPHKHKPARPVRKARHTPVVRRRRVTR